MAESLTKFISSAQLQVKEKEIRAVVKATDSNSLHIAYTNLSSFLALFTSQVKKEFLKRAKKKSIQTDIGKITVCERANYEYDEKEIEKLVTKRNIDPNDVYDITYEVITKDYRKLAKLESEGVIAKSLKINPNKIEALSVKYPSILNYVRNNPTIYVKGLG